jgi:uncharacterized membrane protein
MLRSAALVKHSSWIIPLIYAGAALVAGLIVPRLEGQLFPQFSSPMGAASAIAIYSSIASGMIALTGIVFSLTFVMVQFSSSTYSPRLVLWIARDIVMSNALGVFVATFLYAVAALAGVDRHHSGTVPFISVYIVLALLLASVAMFVALIHRIGLLQINRMLIFIGNQGRRVIETLYPPLFENKCIDSMPVAENHVPTTQVLLHRGRPRAIQAIDVKALVALSRDADAVIELVSSVGDVVVDRTQLMLVKDGAGTLSEAALRRTIALGDGRTFEQDPKYAIRLLVDIAIRALSPAVNDPTTAVQALDQIQDLLQRLGRSQLEIGHYCDEKGKPRVIIAMPEWEDFLRLAFDEIRSYGCTSVQVMRRMRAVIGDLIEALPAQRHESLRHWESRLALTVTRSFDDIEEQREASTEDRQGLGIPRQSWAPAEEIRKSVF